jgi:hypothetical protein
MRFVVFFLLLLNLKVLAQNIELSVCQKDSLFGAYPPNNVLEMTSINSFGDTGKFYTLDTIVTFDEIPFKKVPTKGNDNKIFLFFSEGKNGELYWLDTNNNKVKLFIPNEEVDGYEIKNVLGLDYKIAGYHVKIETPVCKYDDAIMVLMKNMYLDSYDKGEIFYYVRGIGFVATENRGIIESYITRRYILDKKKK